MLKYKSGYSLIKRMITVYLVIAVFFACSSKDEQAESPQVEEADLQSLISVQMPGWEQKETDLVDKYEDIEKYTGEEAGLCTAYGIKRLAVSKYENEDSIVILARVYEFGNSEDAYGMYSFDTVGEKMDIGQGAVYGHGILTFWKDVFLVRVLVDKEYMQVEQDIFSFGRQVDSRILTIGAKPKLLALLPEEKIVPDTVHYFHENVCINNIYYMPESTALNLSERTNALTARYDYSGKQPPLLLLIEYPNGVLAETAFRDFGTTYFQEERIETDRRINIIKMGVDQYSSITLNRNLLLLVLDAGSQDICKKLVAATLAKIELNINSVYK